MNRSLSKTSADKLGRRLAKMESASEEDFLSLQAFRSDYDSPLQEVERILQRMMDFDPVTRLKTANTIIEKVRRDKTRLSSMQDIAGARIVMNMTLQKQDEVVETIRKAFPINRVVDRRAMPSHGYRAVHVIVEVNGFPVEIQIRTSLQHLWAEIIEKAADRWGRQVRYGEPPTDPDKNERPESGLGIVGTRGGIVEALRKTSDTISKIERRRSEPPSRTKHARGSRASETSLEYRKRLADKARKDLDLKNLKTELSGLASELILYLDNILRGLTEEQ